MKRILAPLLILSLLMNFVLIYVIWVFPNDVAEEYESITITRLVERVIDGGTLVVNVDEKIRLLGINTPQQGEECYTEAKQALQNLISHQEVTLIADKDNRDSAGQLLRWVFVGDQNLNVKLVEMGLAHTALTSEKKYRNELITAQQQAKDNKVGCLWSE